MFDFASKVLLLTGAGGGIGKAIARLFYDAGASVLLADVDQAAVEETTTDLGGDDARLVPVRYDASEPADAERSVQECLERFGGVDFVVPAAAIYEELPFASMTDEQWRRTISVNLGGVFYLCRRAAPHIRDGGSIVAIASQSAHCGASIHHAPYGASKGGVVTLIRSLARELAPAIRVNAVSPGFIDTPMARESLRRNGVGVLDATPMRRMGRPSEIADAVAFLCSGASSFITGQALHVNGGAYISG